MAQWLKVETSTPSKPEIRQIARLCSCSRADAFLAFFTFYTYADEQTVDGALPMLTPDDVDEISGLKGFGKALETVNWAHYDDEEMVLHKFDRHNGHSAKRRVMDVERQRRSRACHGSSVTDS